METGVDIARWITPDVAATLLLLAGLAVLRLSVGRAIRARADLPLQRQRRWTANLRNAVLLLGLVGIILIWAPQLRTFALSLTAVAVAIVVATKELILCISGAVLRASSQSFSVGDRIEVAGIAGEVADLTVLATTLHEMRDDAPGSATGRTVTLPNSLLLTHPVRNLTALGDLALHRFSVVLEPAPEAARQRRAIEAAVQDRLAPLADRVEAARLRVERRAEVALPATGPRLRFATTELGKLRVEVAALCPAAEAERLESDITCAILARMPVAGGGAAGPAPEDTAEPCPNS